LFYKLRLSNNENKELLFCSSVTVPAGSEGGSASSSRIKLIIKNFKIDTLKARIIIEINQIILKCKGDI